MNKDKWIKCGLPFGPVYDKKWVKTGEQPDSFTKQGLNRPGTLIKVKLSDGKKKTYLIGDINRLCGVCDDCQAFQGDTTIVEKYKVLDVDRE
jgi:hypothetical protein